MSASRWDIRCDVPRGADYDRRWEQLAAAGQSIHGEADFVMELAPRAVLDAGCGTGRVAIELARRGVRVVGVDLDRSMLSLAQAKSVADAPVANQQVARQQGADHAHTRTQERQSPEWLLADLAELDLRDDHGERRRFDVAVMAGNVMIFVQPGREGEVVTRIAEHLTPGGAMVAGFQLGPGRLSLAQYDRFAADVGLTLAERYATWERAPYAAGDYAAGDYAVSVHRAPA